MPYIERNQRPRLDEYIEPLAEEINKIAAEKGDKAAFAGYLNYCITRLAIHVLPEKRYWAMALVSGVLKNVSEEWYRRVMSPYEDKKMKQAGDVYERKRTNP